jgi:hypothetical protein
MKKAIPALIALWMESDRMAYLDLSQKTLDLQRGVVQNEKRQGENEPYRLTEEYIPESTYPGRPPLFLRRYRRDGRPGGSLFQGCPGVLGKDVELFCIAQLIRVANNVLLVWQPINDNAHEKYRR